RGLRLLQCALLLAVPRLQLPDRPLVLLDGTRRVRVPARHTVQRIRRALPRLADLLHAPLDLVVRVRSTGSGVGVGIERTLTPPDARFDARGVKRYPKYLYAALLVSHPSSAS